jgi:sulfite reductase (NADPH) flavoprotein alpha-component
MDISLIPDSAPFSTEQRAWLNGFLAGWIGLPQNASVGDPAAFAATSLANSAPASPAPAAAPEPEPWHDPALPIDERLKLADDQPPARQLMAAMAQLDCGACGYICRTYAEAIDSGAESRLSLCSPGGSETSRAIKRMLKERASAGEPSAPRVDWHETAAETAIATAGWSREAPYEATVLRSERLNGVHSEKETQHVEIAIGADGPAYEVGDSLGVYPENCPELVDELITALKGAADAPVSSPSDESTHLRSALLASCCLSEVTDSLLESIAAAAVDPTQAAEARAMIEAGPPDGMDVLDTIRRFPSARLEPAAFVASLAAIKPRLYSISSSPKRHAGQVHLTVRRVSYEFNGRARKGVASTHLADRVRPGSPLRVFVQRSHGFRLPANPDAPVIMIGPGTGIAPFRAFLHERDALGARGRTWLFFGDQRSDRDFLYEPELRDLQRRGVLNRLDTAFSRDQEQKIYVQDRILEQGAEVFAWLEDGAHVYVCGDARRMAVDVDRALRSIVASHGERDAESARAYIAGLTTSGRYLRDVY